MASDDDERPDLKAKGPMGRERDFSPAGQSGKKLGQSGKHARSKSWDGYKIPKLNRDRFSDDSDDSESDPYESEQDEFSGEEPSTGASDEEKPRFSDESACGEDNEGH